MEVQTSIREFKYNGVALKDPGAQFTLEQVREFYSTLYPEIINASVEGPTAVGNKVVYEFRRAVGTKGAGLRARLEEMASGRGALRDPLSFPFDIEGHQPLARLIAYAVERRNRSGDVPAARTAAPSEMLALLP